MGVLRILPMVLLIAAALMMSMILALSLKQNSREKLQHIASLEQQTLEIIQRAELINAELNSHELQSTLSTHGKTILVSSSELATNLQTLARSNAQDHQIIITNSQIATSALSEKLTLVRLQLNFQADEKRLLNFIESFNDPTKGVYLSGLRITDAGRNSPPDQQLRVYLEISGIATS